MRQKVAGNSTCICSRTHGSAHGIPSSLSFTWLCRSTRPGLQGFHGRGLQLRVGAGGGLPRQCWLHLRRAVIGSIPEGVVAIRTTRTQGALKGTNLRGQTEPKHRFSLISADFCRFLPFPRSGSFARGRCRQGRSETPHFCSKLLLPALVLSEKKRKTKKSEEKRRKAKKCVKKGENHSDPIYTNPIKNLPTRKQSTWDTQIFAESR